MFLETKFFPNNNLEIKFNYLINFHKCTSNQFKISDTFEIGIPRKKNSFESYYL